MTTDETIRAFVRVYAFFGAACAMTMVVRSVYVSIKMPICAHFLGLFFYCTSIVTFAWVLAVVHSLKAIELVGPLLLVSFWGAYWFTKQLVKLVPAPTKTS